MLTSHAFFLYSLFLLQAFADESTVDQVTLSKNGTAATGNAGKERAFGCVSINFKIRFHHNTPFVQYFL